MNRTALPAFPDHLAIVTWPPVAKVEPFEPLSATARRTSADTLVAADTISVTFAAAFDEGFAAGRAEAMREAEEVVSTMRETQQAEFAAARHDWVTQEADRLTSLIKQSVEIRDALVRVEIASILEACVARAVDAAIVDAFADQVARAVGRMNRAQITIVGRADLSAAVAARLASRGVSAVSTASEDVDLKFELGETIITAVRPAINVSPKETCE